MVLLIEYEVTTAYTTIEDISPQLAQQRTRELRTRLLSGSSTRQHYPSGKRGYCPVVMTRSHDPQPAEAFESAEIHVGDVTNAAGTFRERMKAGSSLTPDI